MSESNTLLYFITRSTDFLKKKGIPNPRLEAEVILSYILGIPRIQLYAKFDMPLTESEKERYRDLIKKRGDNTPTAYILRSKNFYGYDFYVDENVLIPRPETEELVEKSLGIIRTEIDADNSRVRILDLCCGSGCIGIAIALQLKDTSVSIDFVDISEKAVEVSRRNWNALVPEKDINSIQYEARFLESDLFEQFPSASNYSLYHYILTNPPYVLPEEEDELSLEVLQEPRLALVVDNYMEFHKRLLTGALHRLDPHGFLMIETHPKMIKKLEELSVSLGYNSSILKDISGKDRFLLARAS